MKTLLLLPPAGGNAHAFDALLPHLQAHAPEVIVYPGREAGSSALRTVAKLAAFVEEACAARASEALVLLGHSLGGAVALEIALRGKIPLAGLLLVCTGGRLKVHPMILELVREAALAQTPVPVPPLAFGPNTPPELVQEVDAVFAQTAPAGLACDWEAVNGFDRLAELWRITAPTLVLGGHSDTLTPHRMAETLAEKIPGATLLLHPTAGHFLPWEDPAWVAEAIARAEILA